MMKEPTYLEIAESYDLFGERIDQYSTVREDEFEEMTLQERIDLIVSVAGPEPTTEIPLWDRGGHTILYRITVNGTEEQISMIESALEHVKFIADQRFDRPAQEFIDEHFDEQIIRLIETT